MSKWAVALAWVPAGRLAWLFIYAYNSGAQRHRSLIIGHSLLDILRFVSVRIGS